MIPSDSYRKTRGIIRLDTRANQPLATSVLEGTLYFVSDESVIERSNGTTWDDVTPAGGGGGVTDHAALTGLGDDDHPHYHTDARGDARYSVLGHTHAGMGDVVGPAVAVTARIATFDGITGKLIQDGGSTIAQVIAAAVAASGNVVGPASATDNAIARYDATTGKLIQDSVATISDGGNLTIPVITVTNNVVITSVNGPALTINPISAGASQGFQVNTVGLANGSNAIFVNSPAGWTGNHFKGNLNSVETWRIEQDGDIVSFGSIGIGIAPSDKLHIVSGRLRLSTEAVGGSLLISEYAGISRITAAAVGGGGTVAIGREPVAVHGQAAGSYTVEIWSGTNGATQTVTVSGGNVGIGVTPTYKFHVLGNSYINGKLSLPGSTTDSSLAVGGFEMQSYSLNNNWICDNLYYDGGFKYRAAGTATQIYFDVSSIGMYTCPSGSAGAAATRSIRLNIDPNGNIGFNTAFVGASGIGVLSLLNGTAPTSSHPSGVQIYAESGVLKCRGGSGTITTLGPA